MKMMNLSFGRITISVAVMALFAALATPSSAYQKYTEGCNTCHGDFTTSTSSEKPGNTWPGTLHNVHRSSMLGSGTCTACHVSIGDDPDLDTSAGTASLPAIGCLGCHARDNGGNVTGAGLRLHHDAAGVTSCLACHDSDPTPVGEDVLPPYYGLTGVNITDSCNSDGSENWTSDTLGLDNDGDDAYDGDDPDCATGAPDIALVPTALDFGSVLVGATPQLSTVITNVGTADLMVTNLAMTGSTDFDIPSPPTVPFTVVPGGSTTLNVEYAPGGPGVDSGSIEVGSDDPDEPTVSVSLAGTGVICDIDVSPLTLAFGEVQQGSSKTLMVSIGNTGSTNCTVTALALTGSGDFALGAAAPATPFTVAPSSTVMVPVDYNPSDVGADNGGLDITSDDPDESPVTVTLSGSGGAIPPGCDIDVQPGSLVFGPVIVGNSGSLTVTIDNTGSSNCTVTALGLTGSGDFALGAGAPATPFVVAPSTPVQVPVVYTPSGVGADTGMLDVTSDDPDEGVVSVSLSGSGIECDLAVSPSVVNFGTLTVGSSSTESVTLTNQGGASCMVTSLVLTGSSDFDFAPGAPAPPFDIAPNESTNVSLVYQPSDVGSDAADFEVGSDDPDTPVALVTLSGVGEPVPLVCDLTVNPAALAYGDLPVGDTGTLTVQLVNVGTADCTVNSLGLAGSGDYALAPGTPGTPFIVAIGATVDVSVVYSPAEVGTDDGTLSINSTDPAEPVIAVDLSGRGVECDINVSPTTIDFGTSAIGGTATRMTTVSNTGSLGCTVSSLTVTGNPAFALNAAAPATPFDLAPGAHVDVPVDYTPPDDATHTGTLEVTSDDPDEPEIDVALSGTGVEEVVDLDIAKFKVKKKTKLGKPKLLRLRMHIKNNGEIDKPRIATVAGVQDGKTVYQRSMQVSAPVGGKRTKIDFPSYWPTAAGLIEWTATIEDDDPDADEAMAETLVKDRKKK